MWQVSCWRTKSDSVYVMQSCRQYRLRSVMQAVQATISHAGGIGHSQSCRQYRPQSIMQAVQATVMQVAQCEGRWHAWWERLTLVMAAHLVVTLPWDHGSLRMAAATSLSAPSRRNTSNNNNNDYTHALLTQLHERVGPVTNDVTHLVHTMDVPGENYSDNRRAC